MHHSRPPPFDSNSFSSWKYSIGLYREIEIDEEVAILTILDFRAA